MNKPKVVKNYKAPKQNIVFKLITIFIPVFIFLVFEGVLRITGYGDNLNLFVQNPVKGYEKYMIMNPVIEKKYIQKFEYTAPSNDIFLKEKPKNTFRILLPESEQINSDYRHNRIF